MRGVLRMNEKETVRLYGKDTEITITSKRRYPELAYVSLRGILSDYFGDPLTLGIERHSEPSGLTQIKIDVDKQLTKSQLRKSRQRIVRMLRTCGIGWKSLEHIRTMNGYHIVVVVTVQLSATQLLFLQLLCGSDPIREAKNFRRLDDKITDWNLLFSKKIKPELQDEKPGLFTEGF